MKLYEATLYSKPDGFISPYPITIDGHQVRQEYVADTASKARYKMYVDLCDAWGREEVRIQDIRVRSLEKYLPKRNLDDGWEKRLEQVNEMIKVIGSHGRHFLSENSDRRTLVENPFFSYFKIDKRNEIWFIDRYSRKPILVRHRDWDGWSDGGTLRSLVEHFANYIRGGSQINKKLFGPYPDWVCGGDLWGYGDDMQKVRDGIAKIMEEK